VRVLVTGATGFLGAWAARELAARGHSLRVLVRPESRLEALEGVPAELAPGDVTDRRAVERAVAGCDAVLHAAGVARLRSNDLRRLMAVNRGGTVHVLGAALRAGVRRAVAVSSVGALGGTLDPVAPDERWDAAAEASGVDYFVSKLEGERAALAIGRLGLPLVVVRPGVVLGPGDVYHSSTGTVLRMARGVLPACFRGGASFCDVRDVARGQVEALERGTPGEVYHLGGHNLEMAELARRVWRITGVPPPPQVPYELMFAAVGAREAWNAVTGQPTPVSRQLLRGARRYTYLSSEKARRELGYRIRSLEETLRDTIGWFLAHGDLEPRTRKLRTLAARCVPERAGPEPVA
jgi:dihydroflavonol-4-reductase